MKNKYKFGTIIYAYNHKKREVREGYIVGVRHEENNTNNIHDTILGKNVNGNGLVISTKGITTTYRIKGLIHHFDEDKYYKLESLEHQNIGLTPKECVKLTIKSIKKATNE